MENSITNPFLLEFQDEFPEELRKKVVILQCESVKGTCNVYLVGTCHISSQSCKDVEAIIGFLKPDVVFLELCETRSHIMDPQTPRILEVPRFTDAMVAMWKSNNFNTFEILASLITAKVAKKLKVFPGSEFLSAYREAKKYGGEVILGDRPIEITDQRTWSKMSFWYKAKFVFFSLLLLAIVPLVSVDVDASDGNNQDIEREFPSIAQTLIHEREVYMVSRLFEVAKKCKSVVTVVGRGHVAGIQKNWNKPSSIESSMEVKAAPSSSAVKLWTSLAMVAVGIAVFSVEALRIVWWAIH
ncbi:hypothetical protein SUGI_0343680 [Cryptomeria japonica]|uniref:uncharacterized protein LOC131079227 n=1 Tax=Cryptomeria japonica TaxID=3369 RepID=UPI002408CB15|nr:uncharacterized protein LOC131079227 [Cryptomeria japonica]GLJ19137.1 hypothetical protein SUGI_0343680 [Cryptomeria japonica]